MSHYLDSLISERAIAFSKAHPKLTAEVAEMFGIGRSDRYRALHLPTDDCVTPAIFTALGIIAGWMISTADDGSAVHPGPVVLIAGYSARKTVLAAIERDRDSQDSKHNGSPVDTADPMFEVNYGTARNAFDVDSTTDESQTLEARLSHGASAATNPAQCTLSTRGDKIKEAKVVAVDRFGADVDVIKAIFRPDFTGTRERTGVQAIMRAANLPTGGRAYGAAKQLVSDACDALTMAWKATLDRTTVVKIRNSWTDDSLTLSESLVSRPRYGSETGIWADVNFPVTAEQLTWVAPSMISTETNGPTGTPAPRMLGVKVPSRRSGKRGSTGPTIPERLTAEVQVFPFIPTQRSYKAETARIMASL